MSEIDEDAFPSNSKMKRVSSQRLVRDTDNPSQLIPSNAEKKVKKVIKGRAVRRPKTLSQKIADTFLGDDARSVGQYILYDVLLPAAKNTVQEMVSSGIEMLLYGETRGSSRRRTDKGRSIVSYGSFYRDSSDRRDDRNERRPVTSRGRYNFDDIIFERGNEADDVLNGLLDLLEEYEQVTVADFYELAGVTGGTWADQNWGWTKTNLKRAYCTRARGGGYIIALPRPIELD